MHIELFGSSDRFGGNIVDMISQISYAVKNSMFIKYNRQEIKVYNGGYNHRYTSSIFIQTLFDIIDKHNTGLNNEDIGDYVELAAPSHFEVLSRTTLDIKKDLVTYFREVLFTEDIRELFINRAKINNYNVPFDPYKTILIHHRLEDVADREDYDGSICANFMRDKIEQGLIPNNDVLSLSEPSPWCQMQAPLSTDKIIKKVNQVLKDKPDYEIILITNTNKDISDLPYRCISNSDEFYDLFLLCNSETLILSRSNYALTSLFFGISKESHVPLWGHIPCYGLYTKYDENTKIKYFT
jgi:hypothetical protein